MSATKVPAVPSVTERNLTEVARAIKSILDVREGRSGDALDANVTFRDLVEVGIATLPSRAGGGGGYPVIPSVTPPTGYDPTTDLTVPPAPSGFVANGMFAAVALSWLLPNILNYAYTEIWRNNTDAIGNAVLIGTSSTNGFIDYIGNAATRYYWVRFVTQANVTGPYNSASGTAATTSQDPAYLLSILNEQISESELNAALNTRIDLIDGSGAGSVNARIASETAARAQAIIDEQVARAAAISDEAVARNAQIALEVADRQAAIVAEASARTAAIQAEAAARSDAIAIESHQRLISVQDTAQSALQAVIAIDQERVNRIGDVALARQELSSDLTTGLAAEASARLVLAARIGDAEADILSEQLVRASADSALASDISALVADVGANAAAIASEATARADGDSAEANSRSILATQLRGSYTGSDLSQLASGLLYQERIARISNDNSLAQQITLLSAGAGEQFDWKKIWYFDEGVEGWSGNGTPTITNGFLRPANQASDAHVFSPTGIASDGNQYGQVRLRIRKIGSPTFAGYLWWRTSSDTTWDAARRVALSAPTFDANGIGLVTVSPSWSVVVDRIRVDLSSEQTATDYFEIDWVAIGRPAPGASSAQLLEEQVARASADAAETLSREILSTALIGQTDATGVTLAGLTSGLLFNERQARSTADSSIVTTLTSLQTTVTDNYTTLDSAITTEQTARSSADETLATSISTLTSTVTDNFNTLDAAIATEQATRASADEAEVTAREALSVALVGQADPADLTLATLSSGLIFDERSARVSQEGVISTSLSTLNSTVGGLTSTVSSIQETIADLEATSSSDITLLVSESKRLRQDVEQSGESLLRNVLSTDAERVARLGSVAAAKEELYTKVQEDVAAEAGQRLLLAARVNSNEAAISSESVARATADSALASQITTLTATTGTNTAAIVAEATARADADSALSLNISTLTTQVASNTSAISVEQTARADADSALSSQISLLSVDVGDNAAAILAEANARADADSALSEQISLLSVDVGDNAAAILIEASARADADSALSESVTTLQTTVGENTTAIETNAESINGVRAMYTVKIDNNGVMSGFGLTSTIADGGAVTSKFLISADQFAVIAPNRTAGQLNSVPFAVLTTQQTINGVNFQPGVYIDGASINDGTVSKAKIGSVDADTIQAGFVQTVDFSGSTIWGSEMFIGGTVTYEYNYPGQPNRITGIASVANPNIALTTSGAEFNVGYFKIRNFNNVTTPFEVVDNVVRIRNAVIGDGTITSAKIADSIQSTNYAAGSAGWRISKDGTAEFRNVTVRGDVQATSLNAATGTFTGSLSAATGTFSGTLSAADGTFAGTLSAAKISVGTSLNAVTFEDPAQASISLRSIATGVFTFNGNAAIATSVPQTCYDGESGQPYDCSYFVYAAAPVTSNDILFTTNNSSTPISRRLRTGNVRFLVIASATVDHYFSTWYRIWTNGVAGGWVNISEAVEPQSSYGSVSSNGVIEVTLTLGQAIQFGMAPANSSMVFWNSGATEIRYGSLSVIGVNF